MLSLLLDDRLNLVHDDSCIVGRYYQALFSLTSPAMFRLNHAFSHYFFMFALIRHAGYSISSGSLTQEGVDTTLALSNQLKTTGIEWKEIRTSPSTRTKDTATILANHLKIPLDIDHRISPDGNFVELLPPTEPDRIIFISHVPIITKMLRTWSRAFNQEEPPLTEVAGGYIVDPQKQTITPIGRMQPTPSVSQLN